MGLVRAEAARLAQKCLPQMLQPGGGRVDPAHQEAIASLSNDEVAVKSLCRLWAGMGHIYQVTVQLPMKGGENKHTFIVKRVVPPSRRSRSFGDERKAASYLIEANIYEQLAPTLIKEGLAVPVPYHVEHAKNDEVTICMSRLRGSPGYVGDDDKARAVLDWLALLHAATWGSKADGYVESGTVQPIGSYWHLGTRPDEHDSMPRRGWEGRLKLAARAIDERLRRDDMQCCIHGDAKDANMLFEKDGEGNVVVSMYDFQYCGRAPPSVDLAYFFCVAVGDTDREHIRYYHHQLTQYLKKSGERPPSLEDLENSVDLALCDFQRFMSGWGQWGSDISSTVTRVLDRLDGGTKLASEDAYREAMMREYG